MFVRAILSPIEDLEDPKLRVGFVEDVRIVKKRTEADTLPPPLPISCVHL